MTTQHVLVIEDDPSVKTVLRAVLRKAGFEVSEAGSGSQALALLEQSPVGAVVLDLGLPDGKGGAVLEWLRKESMLGDGLPTWVVISAMHQDEIASRYGPLGDHFLAKPFNPWELVDRLKV